MSPELPPDLQKVVRLPCSKDALVAALEGAGWTLTTGSLWFPDNSIEVVQFKCGERRDLFDDMDSIIFYCQSTESEPAGNHASLPHFLLFKKYSQPDLRNLEKLRKYASTDPSLVSLIPGKSSDDDDGELLTSSSMEFELSGVQDINEYLDSIDSDRSLRFEMTHLLDTVYRLGRRVRERELGKRLGERVALDKSRLERNQGRARESTGKKALGIAKRREEVDKIATALFNAPRPNTTKPWLLTPLARAIVDEWASRPKPTQETIAADLTALGWRDRIERP